MTVQELIDEVGLMYDLEEAIEDCLVFVYESYVGNRGTRKIRTT